MTELRCMTGGACRTSAARAELGDYPLQLALGSRRLAERFPGVLVRGTHTEDPLTVAAAAMAWCGPDGLLCRASAAWLAGCGRARGSTVHVLRPHGRNRTAPPGVAIHHGRVPTTLRTELYGLPAVRLDHAVAELLCDRDGPDFGFAVAEEAAALRPPPERARFRARVRARIAERPDRRYRRRGDQLARLLTGRTRSRAACAVLLAAVGGGLPVPCQWFPVRDQRGQELYRLEFAWPACRVALELGAETDLARDLDLAARGWSLVRVRDPRSPWFAELAAALGRTADARAAG